MEFYHEGETKYIKLHFYSSLFIHNPCMVKRVRSLYYRLLDSKEKVPSERQKKT